MYIMVHNIIYNQYVYLIPYRSRTRLMNTLQGSTSFWQKKVRGHWFKILGIKC